MVLLSCLVLLVTLGILERWASRRARAAVPIRIHVNGTRGKSTVTRLIAAALREAGIATLAKVTGTAPRLILADGSERPVARRAPAAIAEQAWLLRRAARQGARALVVECMAVRPELQWVSEREMVHATIGVITNARLDHTDVMGPTRDEIARSLANTVPRRGVLVAGEEVLAETLSACCAALGTRLVVATRPVRPSEAPGRSPAISEESLRERFADTAIHQVLPTFGLSDFWMQQNIATALAVTRELGINDEVALRGMQKAEPDPGAASCGHVAVAGRDFSWIDATAANDPESLDLLVAGLAGAEERRRASLIAVFNHRADRPFRLLTFAQSSTAFRNSTTILLTGNRPSVSLVVRVRRSCPGAAVRFVASRHLEAAVEDALSRATDEIGVLFCGNTRGWTRPVLADCERPPTHLRSSLATSVPSGELRRGRRDQRRMTND